MPETDVGTLRIIPTSLASHNGQCFVHFQNLEFAVLGELVVVHQPLNYCYQLFHTSKH